MDDFQLLIDLHKPNERQGPGGDTETKLAMWLAGLDRSMPLNIADIGCGTGASTILLAQELDATITAVDFLPEFLDELEARATLNGVVDRITTLSCSMEELPFAKDEYDVIWSEGAIYNMGFEAGVSAWKKFLKPGGKLVLSEITWLTDARPSEIQSHWEEEYPDIDVASAKIKILEKHGFSPVGYFVLPKSCWITNYYGHLKNRFDAFLDKNGHSNEARSIVDIEKYEIALYEKYYDYYSYGVYIAKR